MKRIVVFGSLALAAAAWAAWTYEGKWGTRGYGPGQFELPTNVAVSPGGGRVYVVDSVVDYRRSTVQYFTSRGSYLGQLDNREFTIAHGVGVAPNGNVYVTEWDDLGRPFYHRVLYFTPTGSLLGRFGDYGHGNGNFFGPEGIALARNANVYVADAGNDRVQYFTPSGRFLGKWGRRGSGDGDFKDPVAVAFSPNGARVYVADFFNDRVQCFTRAGTFLGKWGSRGTGNGQFRGPNGLAVTPDGTVFVSDNNNDRVQYFTPNGSFLGKWGTPGSGNGQFDGLWGLASSPSGVRLYVADAGNYRIQYFNRNKPAVTPTSLGRVKALFR